MMAFDLPDGTYRDDFIHAMWDKGILLFAAGVRSVRFRPMLDLQREHVDEAVEAIRQTFHEKFASRKP